jgi:hypothetical protein
LFKLKLGEQEHVLQLTLFISPVLFVYLNKYCLTVKERTKERSEMQAKFPKIIQKANITIKFICISFSSNQSSNRAALVFLKQKGIINVVLCIDYLQAQGLCSLKLIGSKIHLLFKISIRAH